MVLPASHKVSRAPWYSGLESRAFLFRLLDSHHLRFAFPCNSTRFLPSLYSLSATPTSVDVGLGSSPFARRYLGNRFFFLFLQVLRCFSSLSFLLITYLFSYGWLAIKLDGFPHSDISGSTLACSSPKLFAAYHVLHRLLVPRHSPYALILLTIFLL